MVVEALRSSTSSQLAVAALAAWACFFAAKQECSLHSIGFSLRVLWWCELVFMACEIKGAGIKVAFLTVPRASEFFEFFRVDGLKPSYEFKAISYGL